MQNPLLGGRYRRERVIGRGAMGEVWLAHDELLDRTVAVKTVSSGGALTDLATPIRDDLLTRIMREARLAARMNHPNAVSVFDLVVEDGQPNVVMEYVQGRTFADEIRASGALDPVRVAEVGAAVAAALAQAHELDITHRDVKPANILITNRGLPKLADFGVAKVNGDAGVTTTGIMLGTPAFVSPEVARGSAADARSDVWSLGATLYAALRGRSPFQQTGTEDAMVVLGRLISQPVPRLGDGPVPNVVMRMLDPDPARRPSAAAVSDALRHAGRDSSDAALTYVPPPVLPPEPPDATWAPEPHGATDARWSQPTELRTVPAAGATHGRRGRVALVAGALVLAAAVAAGVVVVLGSGHHSPRAAARTSTRPSVSATPSPSVVTATVTAAAPVASDPAGSATSTPTSTPTEFPTGDETETYSSPDGLTVDGPAGWSENNFFDVPRTAEYVDGSDYYADPYLHIGVGTDTPNPDWATEVASSRRFLMTNKRYHDISVSPAVSVSYQGTDDAVDIEFTETNLHGVRRHGKERLWEQDGLVYIIQLNTPLAVWSQYAAAFDTMTASCVTP